MKKFRRSILTKFPHASLAITALKEWLEPTRSRQRVTGLRPYLPLGFNIFTTSFHCLYLIWDMGLGKAWRGDQK